MTGTTQKRLQVGVLGSGKGTNFCSILAAIDSGDLLADVAVVVSDVENAGILEFARAKKVPAIYLPPGKYKTKFETYTEEKLVNLLKSHNVDVVVLAGFMRMVKTPMLEAFPRQIVNIHPSLLPKFPGVEAWRQALEAGESVTGCTVHLVDDGMDTGEVLAQAEVDIFEDDTPESLHERIQEAEHLLYPMVLKWIAGQDV